MPIGTNGQSQYLSLWFPGHHFQAEVVGGKDITWRDDSGVPNAGPVKRMDTSEADIQFKKEAQLRGTTLPRGASSVTIRI